ncbi:ABC transporter ATP-binding protein [Yimella sp. RIT 621]|uniref:ABC transporter ATP-binding protein n=1 Tax=Yimella sp. RIT 621 TaxID=2510323 RepID=UPI00101DBA3B|nr:ABC transporter ATP-binding protein [Yimella sp. RIT 621]RYG76453.1 ABC transporter ATP-binding protein [Yimella sp. RIT 621]
MTIEQINNRTESAIPRDPQNHTYEPGAQRVETAAAIVIEALHKSYGAKQALAGIDLRIEEGEFFGVLGPNGAGKTTLIEIVEGLRVADDGRVSVLGADPARRDPDLLRRIGVQTQHGAFFTRLTAGEHLCTMAALYGVTEQDASDALRLVGLSDSESVRVERLSGGQRQRLAIAGALVHRPDVIFLDEPTAALDPQARRELWSVLRDLKDQGRTIVYTTHHLDEAEALCDRVAILVDGKVRALDTPHALKGGSRSSTQVLVPVGRISVAEAGTLDGVTSARESGGSLVLETGSVSRVLVELSNKHDIEDIQTKTASLEDVYLELTA